MKHHGVSDTDLEIIERELEEICEDLCQPDNVPITISLSTHAGMYICTQLKRIRNIKSERDIDLVAYCSRSIFEAVLLLEYMIRHAPKNDPKRILLEMLQDHIDIVNGAAALFKGYPEYVSELQRHRESVIEKAQNSGSSLQRTPRISELAKLNGAIEEYEGLYKLYSKYTHPSAYLLLSSQAKKEAKQCLSIFRDRAHLYATQAKSTYLEVRAVFSELYV